MTISSPKSPHEDAIRDAVARYQKTFGSGDKEGWLALFAEDGSMEDPVGSPVRKGREELSAFWDEARTLETPGRRVVHDSGPNVCGLEAAWAFHLEIPLGDEKTVYVPIIDVCLFNDEGKIVRNRAFWSEAGIRVE